MTTTPRYLLGAYAALPARIRSTDAGDVFMKRFAGNNDVDGFEVPFIGPWTDEDVDRIAAYVQPTHRVVITTLPGTVTALRQDPLFGLASPEASGRRAAVAHLASVRHAVQRLHSRLSRRAVSAICIASAPRGPLGTRQSISDFGRSLQHVGSWDWDGAQIVVEHCDAASTKHPPAKGFMTLSGEIEAATTANTSLAQRVGICINWGRSVLETRHTSTALHHIAAAQATGLLAGLMFSGCSARPSAYGPAWADVHLPPASEPDLDCGTSYSLLTRRAMSECLTQLRDPDSVYIGLKVSTPPDMDEKSRANIVDNSLSVLRRADVCEP